MINIFVLIALGIWLIMAIYWVLKSKKNGILNEVIGLIKIIGSGLVVFLPAILNIKFLTYIPVFPIQIIGLLIVVFGFIICILAREYLSINWSGKIMLQERHALIQNGPYKIIRHPIYSGLLVMMLGSSIIIGNLIDFIWVFFCLFGLFRKAKQEEKLLSGEFGESFEQYKNKTKMLIPYIL
jgi:protein-S-isoprenylcysteine O-methyltransferase Ste14